MLYSFQVLDDCWKGRVLATHLTLIRLEAYVLET
jgi:hypothetical protein